MYCKNFIWIHKKGMKRNSVVCEKEERSHSTALSVRYFEREQRDEAPSVTAAN